MNKKLVSLAVGSLFVSPVFADALSNPQIGVKVLDGYYQDGNVITQSVKKVLVLVTLS